MTPLVSTAPDVQIQNTTVHLNRDDITELEVDGFVYYAQPNLALGSGTGGAIAVRGGASIQKELDALVEGGTIPTGEAVVSGGGKLKAKHIIHAVGPRFREPDTESKLRDTVSRCLQRAEEEGMRTLAFPVMGSGYYGIPPEVSAAVMLEGFQNHLTGGSKLEEIFIRALDTPKFKYAEAALATLG